MILKLCSQNINKSVSDLLNHFVKTLRVALPLCLLVHKISFHSSLYLPATESSTTSIRLSSNLQKFSMLFNINEDIEQSAMPSVFLGLADMCLQSLWAWPWKPHLEVEVLDLCMLLLWGAQKSITICSNRFKRTSAEFPAFVVSSHFLPSHARSHDKCSWASAECVFNSCRMPEKRKKRSPKELCVFPSFGLHALSHLDSHVVRVTLAGFCFPSCRLCWTDAKTGKVMPSWDTLGFWPWSSISFLYLLISFAVGETWDGAARSPKLKCQKCSWCLRVGKDRTENKSNRIERTLTTRQQPPVGCFSVLWKSCHLEDQTQHSQIQAQSNQTSTQSKLKGPLYSLDETWVWVGSHEIEWPETVCRI